MASEDDLDALSRGGSGGANYDHDESSPAAHAQARGEGAEAALHHYEQSVHHGVPQVGRTLSFPSLPPQGQLSLTTDDIISVLTRGEASASHPGLHQALPPSNSTSTTSSTGNAAAASAAVLAGGSSSSSSSSSSPQPIPFASSSLYVHPKQQYDYSSYEDVAFPLDGGYSYGTPSYAGSFVGSYESSSHLSNVSAPSSYNNEGSAPSGNGSGHLPPPPPDQLHGSAFDYYYQQELLQQHLQGGFHPEHYQQPYLNPADSNSAYPSFLHYRERSADQEDAASSYAPSEAGDSVAGSVSGAAPTGVNMEFDFDPVIADRRSESPFAVDAGPGSGPTLSMGDPMRQDTEVAPSGMREQATLLAHSTRPSSAPRSSSRDSNRRNGAPPGFVLSSGMLSESPPTSSAANEFRVSPPALTPLAIPTDGPSFNVIQPTPHTARPKEKGQQTLELERMLGMGEWPSKVDQHASFSEFTPRPIAAGSKQFPPNPPILTGAITSAPEPIEPSSSSAGPSTSGLPAYYPHLPRPGSSFGASLDLFHPTPTRKRSKSDPAISPAFAFPPPSASFADAMPGPPPAIVGQAPYAYFFPSSMPGGQGQFIAPAPAMSMGLGGQQAFVWPHATLPPMVMNPSDAYQPPGSLAPGGGPLYTEGSALDLDDGGNISDSGRQHSLEKRSRSSVSGRRPFVGTPGYQEAGMLAHSGGAPGHRRSKSHTGHMRNAASESYQTNYGYGDAVGLGSYDPTTMYDLSHPNQSSASRSSPYDEAGDRGGQPMPVRTTSGSSATSSSFLGPQRTPHIYHSPVASPSANAGGRQGSTGTTSDAGSAEGRRNSGSLSLESKTTAATIEAAMRRRNPGTQAKFACDLCGETFTRRYNLRGHQRAHRNEKPFACHYPGCSKAFARAHDCKRHELLHLDVRRYSCEPCKREFVRLDALQRHHRSDVGQACVEQLKTQGFLFSFDETEDVPF